MNLFKKYSLCDIVTFSFFIFRLEFFSRIYSFLFKLRMCLLGVKVGRQTKVFGSVSVLRFPSSHISFGTNCNLIGCNMKAGASSLGGVRLRTFSASSKIIIESNVDLNGTSISCRSKKVLIKKNTLIGPNVVISDSDFHCITPEFRIPGKRKACFENDQDIIIGENVWIGMNCIILKGVVIGDNSVIGAGSVVTKNVDEKCIYAGNPAKKIREI